MNIFHSFDQKFTIKVKPLSNLEFLFSVKAGARIVIHNSMTKALVDEFGHDLSPNKHTQIAIQEVNNVVLLIYILKSYLSKQ